MTGCLRHKFACWAVFGLLLVSSCSFVRFERGPYAIRVLEVVYSEQEDMTFFSWRLRKDAKLSLVAFELWRDGDYVPIALDEAPFPAEPYECGSHWCFQYQVEGEYDFPEDGLAPLRSMHEDEGFYAGPEHGYHRTSWTFGIDPIALGRNETVDPKLADWFSQNEIPMRRDFQWALVDHDEDGCASASDAFEPLDGHVSLDYAWVERDGVCLAVRPRHTRGSGHIEYAPFVPSAETYFARQTYVPPKEESPVVYGLLLDMEIPNEQRCAQVKSELIEIIEANFSARGEHVRLDVYTPLSPETGQALGGCEQHPRQDYPIELMLKDAREAQARFDPQPVRILWVYVNNVELPPSQRVIDQLMQLGLELESEEHFENYTWAIGSNVVLQMFPWDSTTGWRPIEDDTFRADIKSVARRVLPFTTMKHSDQTEVDIQEVAQATDPRYFKLCQSTPVPFSAIGVPPSYGLFGPSDPYAPWPPNDLLPYYYVSLEPQYLVPSASYVRRRIDIVVEVCERFCDNPFRTHGGIEYDSWRDPRGVRPMEICQWSDQ